MKNKNWLIQGGVLATLIVIILGGFVNPILIYMALFFIGILSIINMYRLDRYMGKATETKELEDLDVPPKPPYFDAIEKAKEYIEEGLTKEEITEGLKKKYDEDVVDYIIKQMEVKENGS